MGSSETKYQPNWSQGSPFQLEKLAGANLSDLTGREGGSPLEDYSSVRVGHAASVLDDK